MAAQMGSIYAHPLPEDIRKRAYIGAAEYIDAFPLGVAV